MNPDTRIFIHRRYIVLGGRAGSGQIVGALRQFEGLASEILYMDFYEKAHFVKADVAAGLCG